jgi:hypothetical protein
MLRSETAGDRHWLSDAGPSGVRGCRDSTSSIATPLKDAESRSDKSKTELDIGYSAAFEASPARNAPPSGVRGFVLLKNPIRVCGAFVPESQTFDPPE